MIPTQKSTEDGIYSRAPYEVVNPTGKSPIILVCEHASNYMPEELSKLGLSDEAAAEHIAWDIGALPLARELAFSLDAVLLVANYSRLIIDLNRPLAAPDSIPEQSEIYRVPGNEGLSLTNRGIRITKIYEPFHEKLAALIEQQLKTGKTPRVVGIHTFTSSYRGVPRPWPAGVLYGRAHQYAKGIIDGLSRSVEPIGNNQPYVIHASEDVTVPVHGDSRGLDSVLIEIRNNEVRTALGVQTWVRRLAAFL